MQAGCCGLAGSWGFEAGHYEISMQAGEQGLLPTVRELPLDELVVANGFSCKTQIEQGDTGRRALHVAQVMKMAREHGPEGVRGPRPEREYYEVRPKPTLRAPRRAAGRARARGRCGYGRCRRRREEPAVSLLEQELAHALEPVLRELPG